MLNIHEKQKLINGPDCRIPLPLDVQTKFRLPHQIFYSFVGATVYDQDARRPTEPLVVPTGPGQLVAEGLVMPIQTLDFIVCGVVNSCGLDVATEVVSIEEYGSNRFLIELRSDAAVVALRNYMATSLTGTHVTYVSIRNKNHAPTPNPTVELQAIQASHKDVSQQISALANEVRSMGSDANRRLDAIENDLTATPATCRPRSSTLPLRTRTRARPKPGCVRCYSRSRRRACAPSQTSAASTGIRIVMMRRSPFTARPWTRSGPRSSALLSTASSLVSS